MMTDEELGKIRRWCDKYWGIGNTEKYVPAGVVTWIGCQAPAMLAHIDDQAAQMATLKAALIGRDLRLLESCNGECGKNNNQPEDCDQCEHDTANLIIEMRNNADLLLSIAEAFQPGDAELMKWALDETEDTGSPIRKMLHRLQAAAERLEGQ